MGALARGLMLATPTLLAASIVISTFSETGGNWPVLLRPLSLTVVMSLVITAIAVSALRRVGAATLASTATVLMVMGGRPLLMAVGVIAVWSLMAQWRQMHQRPLPRSPMRALVIFGVAIFGTSAAWLPLSGAITPRDFVGAAARAERSTEMPSIYVLVLDSYLRQDTLAQAFGYDNEPFLGGLEEFNFEVYREATSRTIETPLTMLTMLSGDTNDLPDNWVAAAREVRRRLAVAPALDELSVAGYERVVINSSAVHVTMSGWDVTVQPGQVNNLEAALLSRSPFAPLLTSWVFDQQRERFRQSLEALVSLVEPEHQRVVLAHLAPPHPPLLFGRDGWAASPAGCWPRCDLFAVTPATLGMTRDDFAAAFVDQISVVNERVMEVIEQMLARDPNAVVITMSDHGTRSSLGGRAEWNRILLASRTPGHDRPLAGNLSPVDLFRRLMAVYADDEP